MRFIKCQASPSCILNESACHSIVFSSRPPVTSRNRLRYKMNSAVTNYIRSCYCSPSRLSSSLSPPNSLSPSLSPTSRCQVEGGVSTNMSSALSLLHTSVPCVENRQALHPALSLRAWSSRKEKLWVKIWPKKSFSYFLLSFSFVLIPLLALYPSCLRRFQPGRAQRGWATEDVWMFFLSSCCLPSLGIEENLKPA